jgi:hypothetical protein
MTRTLLRLERGRALITSANQMITLAEMLSALMTEEYLDERAKKCSSEIFETAMSKVPDTEPEDEDKI